MQSVVHFRSLFAPYIVSRYPEVFLKYYICTWQSEIILEFPWKNSSNACLNFVGLCLEMSSDFNYKFGFVVEEVCKRRYTIKSRCSDTRK